MTVLLNCSTSWCQNDNAKISSTGELINTIIKNDDIIMREYSCNIDALEKQIIQVKKQRNLVIGGGVLATLSMAILAIFK